jgi:hypothetical protein
MRYEILVYQKRQEANGAAGMEGEQWRAACESNAKVLAERGYLVALIELGLAKEKLLIERHNNELELEAEAIGREQETLIRVIQIEAHDLNHALQIATAMPELYFARLELYSPISNCSI